MRSRKFENLYCRLAQRSLNAGKHIVECGGLPTSCGLNLIPKRAAMPQRLQAWPRKSGSKLPHPKIAVDCTARIRYLVNCKLVIAREITFS